MTKMTVVDVVNIIYPGQMDLNNINFGQDRDGPIFITKWTVPGVLEPTMAELEAKIPELQKQFDINYFINIGQAQLMVYMDEVANEKQYSSAVSCASYVDSTIPEWKSQAITFVSWRDNVFIYTFAQIQLMKNGERLIPSFEEFKNELPKIIWPQ